SSVETASAAGPPDCFRNEKPVQYSCTNLQQCIYNKYTRRSSCSSISPTWIRLVVTVQPGCTNLGLGTLFHSKPMPAITAALGEATVGQRLNPNRAWQPFEHASIVGEHKAKVNGNLQFLPLYWEPPSCMLWSSPNPVRRCGLSACASPQNGDKTL